MSTTKSVSSNNSTADSIQRGSFPIWFTDDLLELIEANGGIQRCRGTDHHLEKLLNTDKDKFGEPGHHLRRRIQQKVYSWQQKYVEGKYKSAVLDTRSTPIVPFEARGITISHHDQQDQSDQESEDSSDGTSIESESIVQPVIAIPKGRRGVRSKKSLPPSTPKPMTRNSNKSEPKSTPQPPKEVAFETDAKSPSPLRNSMKKAAASAGSYGYKAPTSKSVELPDDYSKLHDDHVKHHILSISLAHTLTPVVLFSSFCTANIIVNTKMPEANREFYVYELEGIPSLASDIKFPGYAIVLPCEYRRAVIDEDTIWYQAHVIEPDKVLVKCAAYPMTLSEQDDLKFVKDFCEDRINKPHLFAALNRANNQYVSQVNEALRSESNDGHDRRFKYFLLHFPEGTELSSSTIYDEAGHFEELESDIVPVKFFPRKKHRTKPDGSTSNASHFVVFQVARVDDGARMEGSLKIEDKIKSKTAEKAAKLDDSMF
jgi:hypothetical protein